MYWPVPCGGYGSWRLVAGGISTPLTLLIAVAALFMVADVPPSAVLPAFMQESVGVSARLIGTPMSVRGIASLLGGLVVVVLGHRIPESWLLIGD